MPLLRKTLNSYGLKDVGVTPGETSNWYRFYYWGYADAIAENQNAMQSIGLITSHGFYNGRYGKWFGEHNSLGADVLRSKNSGLHAWVTSTSWSQMDASFIKSDPYEVIKKYNVIKLINKRRLLFLIFIPPEDTNLLL